MRIWWTAVGWMATFSLVLFLITTNVRIAANSITVYGVLFERNSVVERTGITEEDLLQVGRDIQGYFRSNTEPLRVSAEVFGVRRELFGPDEVSHMYDVKQLFLKTYRVQLVSGLFLLVAASLYLAIDRRAALYTYTVWLRWAALIAIGFVLAIGIASVFAFRAVFHAFHLIGFPQGNFLFDTSTDYLVKVFPFGFWQDITFFIGILSIVEAGLIFVAALILQRACSGTATEIPDVSARHRTQR